MILLLGGAAVTIIVIDIGLIMTVVFFMGNRRNGLIIWTGNHMIIDICRVSVFVILKKQRVVFRFFIRMV